MTDIKYPGWLSMLALNENLAVADMLASLFAAEPGDANAFSNGVKAYPVGTTFQPPAGPMQPTVASAPSTARYVGVSCTQGTLDNALEFISEGPYPKLTARGLTLEQIALFKGAVLMDPGLREEAEPRWSQFLADNGHVTEAG